MKIQIFLHHGQHPDHIITDLTKFCEQVVLVHGILSWDGKWVTLFNLDIQYNYNIFA